VSLPEGWIIPDWPAPASVRAFVTTRAGGVSEGPYASMNLGQSSGDRPESVARNRAILAGHLPAGPRWLRQVHGNAVADADREGEVAADAAVTRRPGVACAVLTADCLPVFLCDAAGTTVGMAHAGWRGLAAGIVERTVEQMGGDGARLMAWLGPAIGPRAFEVGAEVRTAFLAHDPAAQKAFVEKGGGKYLADLFALARLRLAASGVTQVSGGAFCTWTETGRFFSYRREKQSGRMASVIWRE
jgi:YfiH family protein